MNKEFQKRLISSIILLPTTVFLIIKGSFLFSFFILICFLITSYEWHKMTKKKIYYLPGLLFLILSFYCAYDIRIIMNNGDYTYFIVILLICISSDSGGYFFGKIFKGPKLTKISPKKTFSGVIGGYLLSVIILSMLPIFNIFDQLESTSKFFIFILLISTISQLGDIFISYIKRLSKIKDTGKIIPGHGGLLDRIDGMIFAFPFSYLILKTNILQYF